jgi:hypothetical protein
MVDGATIKPFLGERLIYLPRNTRAHRLYGMSPVEQIALTINIALRREACTLEYYNSGSVPDAFGTTPEGWGADLIHQFEDDFDAKMAGNLYRRHKLKFMPAGFRLMEYRQPPLKDAYDEWLARVICYAFSVPATPFVSQVNRATSETSHVGDDSIDPLQQTQTLQILVSAGIKTREEARAELGLGGETRRCRGRRGPWEV